MQARLKKVLETSDKLKSCQTKFCQQQLKESEKHAVLYKTQLSKVAQQFIMKQITAEEYKAKVESLKSKLFTLPQTHSLGICLVDKCQKDLVASFKALLEIYKTQAKGDFAKMQLYNHGVKLLNAKTMNVDDYIKLTQIISSSG